MPKIFHDKTVYDATIERLNFIFDEFEDIYVTVSGGKDSTVVFNMALNVARERGRELGVMFLDQEFEYQSTIDLIRKWMHEPGVKPFWLQAPMRMYNANSPTQPYVEIWSEEREDTWMHPFEPGAIHQNFCDSNRFHPTLAAFVDYMQDKTGRKSCGLTGLRAEESFNRFRGCTSGLTYKDITWGRKNGKIVSFHPIYDWTFRDVWKYINDSGVEYNPIYDKYYQLGLPISEMRVSNLIHEFTLGRAQFIQELEPETYEKLIEAIPGLATTAKFADEFIPTELPEAFVSWKEYRDYLLDTIVDPQYKQGFIDAWKGQIDDEKIHRLQAIECIKSDVTHTVNKDRTQFASYQMKKTAKRQRIARMKEKARNEQQTGDNS